MIESLKASDRASVVAYDDTVQVFAESRPIKSKEQFKAAIAHIHEGGGTNLHGGWLKGAEEAAKHLDPTVISRVLLLSDGNANVGLTNLDEIASQCAQLADTGVTTSTYGLGLSFNEDLMMAMARAGRGNGYYSQTADALLERFREEFSLLAALCAREMRLRVTPLPGIRCELLNLYEPTKEAAWRLPDLVYDGEAWAAIRLHVNPSALPAIGETVAILQASVSFRDLAGSESQLPETWLSLPVLTEEAFRVLPEVESVARRFHEAEAARLQEFASRAARQGDWSRVDSLLAQARDLASNSPWLNEVVTNLERLAALRDDLVFSKEARYAAASLSAKLRHKMESAALSDEGTLPSHLQRKIRQGAKGKHGAE
jgi:Ca-activated chloride channel family protein